MTTGGNGARADARQEARTVPVTLGVIGAGVGGSALALVLERTGIRSLLFERAAATPSSGLGVILMPNGLSALDRLGLGDAVRARGITARTAERRTASGRLLREKPLPEHVCLFRNHLVEVLHEAMGAVPRWGRELRALDHDHGGCRLRFVAGPDVEVDGVVGADGRGSAVRREIVGRDGLRPTTIKELINVVRAPDIARALEGRLVKFYSEGGGLAVGLSPTGDGWVFWYVQFDSGRYPAPADDPESRARFSQELTRGWADPLSALVAATDYRASYLVDVTVMDTPVPVNRGPVVLIGDAAHPLPTLLGQGANSALEDAVALGETLREVRSPADLPAAFAAYSGRRLPRIQRLHDRGRTAVHRFIHMTPHNEVAQ